MRYTFIALLLLLCGSSVSYAQVDTTIGIKAPRKVSRDYKKLAHYLCDTLTTERAKANAIYNWVTHNIRYDVKAMEQGSLRRPDAKQVLKRRKALCDGYADVIVLLGREAGLSAVVVSGYARDWTFDDSDKFYMPRHAWNAVAVEDGWQLIDAAWGAGTVGQYPGWMQRKLQKAAGNLQSSGKLKFKFHYNPAYCMADPEVFRIKHLPADPVWQLTDTLMPIYIFEAGEPAILAFNEISKPQREGTELSRLSLLEGYEKVIMEADRSYAYNPRNYVSMAAKHQAAAVDSVAALQEYASLQDRQAAMAAVKEELRQADELVAQQKKTIGTEYNELKRKNKTKNMEAQKDIRAIRSDNKKMKAQCEAHIKASAAKKRSVAEKGRTAQISFNKVIHEKPAAIKPGRSNQPDPRLAILQDSMYSRMARLEALERTGKLLQEDVDELRRADGRRLDSLADYLIFADSALVQQTIGRINMYDNRDAEVIKWSRLFRNMRYELADTMQQRYIAGYDTVLTHFEIWRKNRAQQLDLCQKIVKDALQSKRWNGPNSAVTDQYDARLQQYKSTKEAYDHLLSMWVGYIDGNKNLFEKLVKLYDRQEKLTGYMERSENHRKSLEEQHLKKKEAFDKRENEKQKQQLKHTGEKAERYLTEQTRTRGKRTA